ncbi:Asp-tRNA(Asn)/Glu-tRNA(Gln) amidotransferase subunit GatA [Desulforamulus ferrireducens]|uniref:Glutamyl-tRNA(Gln) amidotransferase subunit A n=1 Tax=Desulforamulus ferrireducens TaxID=1833852 RepID=A0A1S6IXJ0_9FIRM|nr:Asp-tRNA(Asn)/Glu-tRNA(Gln) amidotransferase subunit GatA [Desulforamulus ferrireducens]AQS59493.1 aspartyl/glutamyl-tRNA amidotransferase subunit A [Desulforamulus ferrireducens]
MQLNRLSVHQLSELLKKNEISSEEITKDYLQHIDQVEDDIKAFVTVTGEDALAQARSVDEKRSRGEELSPLAGIPMAITDNICTKGIKTTCASQILYNFVPPYDATVTERLKGAGAVLLGKCNMDEFAMGSSTENSGFFNTRNPFDLARVPGGASGGAAAAVAAGEAAFTLGTDTDGAIRQPASFCGVIGLKPTYGYVSKTGLISHASSLDQIGPITRDITDLALVLNVICGYDSKDSTSVSVDVPDFKKNLVCDVKGLKIGLPKEYFETNLSPEVAAKIQEAVRKLEELGAVCEEVSLPHTEYAPAAHYIISSAEASSNLARYDGVRHGLRVEEEDVLSMFKKTRSQGFGDEVKRRIMLGTFVLSTANYEAYYVKALKVRNLVRQDFDQVFKKYDLLLTPTSPSTAFPLAEKVNTPLAMYQSHIYNIPVNLAGLPAMSLPFGMVQGLSVGLQLIARPFDEGTLLRVGYTLEQSTDQTRPEPALSR